jgi:hypothetical protein
MSHLSWKSTAHAQSASDSTEHAQSASDSTEHAQSASDSTEHAQSASDSTAHEQLVSPGVNHFPFTMLLAIKNIGEKPALFSHLFVNVQEISP